MDSHRSLRILYLHQHYSRPTGSTATRSFLQARALAEAGHDVTLACGRYRGAETGLDGPFRRGRRSGAPDGFTVVEFDIPYANAQSLPARSLGFLRYAAATSRLALRASWDLVVASSTPLTVALPALLARRRRGTPFLFEIRDPWPELPRALSAQGGGVPGPVLVAMEPLADAACRRAAAVVALTEGMAETALARGADPRRMRVLPQGADLDLFGPHVPPWRPDGVAPEDVLAIYAGAHGVANGLGQLLDAATLLRGSSLRLLLVRLHALGELFGERILAALGAADQRVEALGIHGLASSSWASAALLDSRLAPSCTSWPRKAWMSASCGGSPMRSKVASARSASLCGGMRKMRHTSRTW
jgi:hypothetical protein